MQKTRTNALVRRFNKLDFHDDGMRSVKIYPLHKGTNSTNIDLEFLDDSTGATKLLSFRDSANLRCLMDFDVLSSNWFAQTERAVATTDVERMKKFVLAQTPHWRVKYMSPSPRDKPIRKKLSSIGKYLLFRVTFFGGTVEVLAKNCKLSRKRHPPTG